MTETQCAEMIQPRRPVGVMGKGRESTVAGALRRCSHSAVPGDDLCSVHAKQRDDRRTILAERRAGR